MTHATVTVNGVPLMMEASGALWWPERRILVVADLHLEKGSGFAARGAFLPPYDTRATIEAVERLVRRHRPAAVVALGDSFHDAGARARLAEADGERLRRLTGATDWLWIAGNHDPVPPEDLGGRVAAEVTLGALTFRHAPCTEAGQGSGAGEICGHLHPKASVAVQARLVTARCFVTDGRRMVLPAFGAFTGGLDVHDEAFRPVFRRGFRVFLAGTDRLHMFPAARLARRQPSPVPLVVGA